MTEFKINYRSPFLALLFFSCVFGYAKIPYLGFPIAIFVFIIDWKNFYYILTAKAGRWTIATCGLFFSYSFIRLVVGPGDLFVRNLIFLMALCFKVFAGLYAAYLFSFLIKKNHNLIFTYILIQISFIFISAFNEDVFRFLLLFQTQEAVDVFGEIFGIRSLGFGIIHNEGVIFLSLIYVFYFQYSAASRLRLRILGFLLYVCAFSSRTIFLLISFWQILKDKIVLVISFSVFFGFVYLASVDQGPLYEFFELFITYKDSGVLGARSVDGIINMQYMPSNLATWLIGDGQFFSNVGFYQDTDIGFSRIIFFGGSFGLFFYMVLNCWPLILVVGKSRVWVAGLIFLIWTFLIGNVKGISVQNFSFVAYYLFYLLNCNGSSKFKNIN